MKMSYEEFRKKIVELQTYLNLFKVEFLDRDSFRRFCDDLRPSEKHYRGSLGDTLK
jgi:hypothetical protein